LPSQVFGHDLVLLVDHFLNEIGEREVHNAQEEQKATKDAREHCPGDQAVLLVRVGNL